MRTLRIPGHMNDINAVCFSKGSGQVFFSGSDDCMIKAYDKRVDGCLVGSK